MPKIDPHLKKRIRLIIFGFVLFTLFFTAFGDRGLLKIFRLKKELKRLETSLKTLEQQNRDLAGNIRKIKKERVFQERSARESLGVVQADEIVYEFPNPLSERITLTEKRDPAVNKIAGQNKK